MAEPFGILATIDKLRWIAQGAKDAEVRKLIAAPELELADLKMGGVALQGANCDLQARLTGERILPR